MVLEGKLLRVVDGDTYDVEVDVSHLNPEQPVWRARIRCAYYNAPEKRAIGGPEATAALAALLVEPLRIETKGRDDWKRVIAETYPAGSEIPVSATMMRTGHGLPVPLHLQLSR